MSADRLRPLLPQLVRYLRNHGHAKSARHTSGHRPGLMPEFRGMSSIARPLEEMTAGDSQAVPTTPAVKAPAVKAPAVKAPAVKAPAAKATAERKVAILWDLDNKKPWALPEDTATSIRSLAVRRGTIVEYSAMANFHAFIGLPLAARELKKDWEKLLAAEERGEYKSAEPLRCPICGSKFATNIKLKKHYESIHERERRKKLTHLSTMKGKKIVKMVKKLEKRNRVHTLIKAPEREHKLYRSLKRAGVLVRIVAKAPQAADKALNSRFAYVKKSSALTLIIISDDSDFSKMAQNAKKKHGVHVIVINDLPGGKLAKVADEWLSWKALNDNAQNKNLLSEDPTEAEESGSSSGADYEIDDDVIEELLNKESND
ncbi:hypothetical protein F5X99DRAFT_232733 [Biscogniauxia marginata]|nr:hypothetical protein F5X99DRAFT_232733 [Biscogniauxia marginata]